MVKRILVVLSIVVVGLNVCSAANPFDEVYNQLFGQATAIAQARLDNFAKDLGSLLGGGTFHQGKSLGIPGFDVGIHIPASKVSDDNVIMKQANIDTVMLPILQAEIGLPAKIDVLARFTSYSDASLVGAGIRYGILKKGIPGVPSLSVQAVYSKLSVSAGLNKLEATTLSLAAIASINLPIVTPYAGLGLDSTTVTPDATIVPGLEGKASNYRLEAGVNLSLVPLTYLQAGGTLINGTIGYTVGLGVKF